MKPVIEVQGLSKRYQRGGAGASNSTLREALMSVFSAKRGASRQKNSAKGSEFWALRDVNFTVNEGDVVGVIGSNGAGKSTLLKVLSRITEPTMGQVTLRGRMASLLEVGTGFHPELTGRENIYLNGTILGMSRQEITRKFDEIVEFAEIGEFLDTPVKHYSSGMYVRLAFAVSAHLAPEILVVDEVLAVGDVSFQKKCLGKMSEVSSQGRTVLFVSHNMAAVENLCRRGIVLRQGQLVFDGAAKDAIQSYLGGINGGAPGMTHHISLRGPGMRQPNHLEILREMQLLDGLGHPLTTPVPMGQPLQVALDAHFARPLRDAEIGVGLDSVFGQRLVTYSTALDDKWPGGTLSGERRFLCRIAELPLTAGEYRLKVFVRASGVVLDAIENACQFQVIESDMFGTGKQPYGAFASRSRWQVEDVTVDESGSMSKPLDGECIG